MTAGTHGLPVPVLVPEQRLIAPMWNDVIHLLGVTHHTAIETPTHDRALAVRPIPTPRVTQSKESRPLVPSAGIAPLPRRSPRLPSAARLIGLLMLRASAGFHTFRTVRV